MKYLILAFLLVNSCSAFAQHRTDYYANGTKKFSGKYKLGWLTEEWRDYVNQDTSYQRHDDVELHSMIDGLSSRFWFQRAYYGKCTFYYANGNKSLTGRYKNGQKNGRFTYWYATGEKESERKYKNGMATGTWTAWYKGGKKKWEQSYKPLNSATIDSFYSEVRDPKLRYRSNVGGFDQRKYVPVKSEVNALINYKGGKFEAFEHTYSERCIWDGDFTFWYENGNKQAEMHYADNQRMGAWTLWDPDGSMELTAVFEGGIITNGTDLQATKKTPPGTPTEEVHGIDPTIGGAATPAAPPSTPVVFSYVEQMPIFSGGDMSMLNYMEKNIHYPEQAKKDGIEGRVVVNFVVNADGSLSDVKVVRGIGGGCDEEAARLITNMPRWTPGKQSGKAVAVRYTLPIRFTLQTK